MSKAKHTAGPWAAFKRAGKYDGYNIHGGAGARETVIAVVKGSTGVTMTSMDEEEAANASLIAAGPELLEALKEIVAISDRKHDAWDRAKAAIAKAQGEA